MNDIEEIPNEKEKNLIKGAEININLSELRKKLFPEINPKDIAIKKERIGTSRVCSKEIVSTRLSLSRIFMPKIYMKMSIDKLINYK